MNLYKIVLFILVIVLGACSTAEWKSSRSIVLKGISPIGIAMIDDDIWISDGDHNRMVVTDMNGAIIKTYDNIDRPMHIEAYDQKVFVPSYIADHIILINAEEIDTMAITEELEAPAAIALSEDIKVIADFYNNRLVVQSDGAWSSIGKKGKGELEFSYPTDVQIANDKIYVADAYNNRIQVLDKEGNFLQFIGSDQGMNAATGLYVNSENVFITDFENDRILIFDLEGKVQQIIDQGLNKPTDLIVHNDLLYVTNYNGKYISVYNFE